MDFNLHYSAHDVPKANVVHIQSYLTNLFVVKILKLLQVDQDHQRYSFKFKRMESGDLGGHSINKIPLKVKSVK